jgi:hypothetical protein
MMQWLFAIEMVTMLRIRLSMVLSGTLTELTGRFIRSVSRIHGRTKESWICLIVFYLSRVGSPCNRFAIMHNVRRRASLVELLQNDLQLPNHDVGRAKDPKSGEYKVSLTPSTCVFFFQN